MTSSNSNRFDVYEAITNQIITAIEAGAGSGKVQLPWHRSGASITRPVNIASKNPYRGVNTIALWAAADAHGYAHGIWGTYRQWQERGAQVRKGEKSSLIVFYKQFDREDDAATDAGGDDDANGQRRFMARASYVFNAAQVDGYQPDATAPEAGVTSKTLPIAARTWAFLRVAPVTSPSPWPCASISEAKTCRSRFASL